MIKPRGDDYYADTQIVHTGPLCWAWKVTLRQPWPAIHLELDESSGCAPTERAARRRAARHARRMMRAAASWISLQTTTDHGTTGRTTP